MTNCNSTSDELNNFWRSILKNDAASSRIFSISIDDVENEISHPNDRELFITALESLEIEKGQEDWIMSKPGFKSTSFHCTKSRPVMFLSKLPDGVFISGTTSRALGRHHIDFTTLHDGIFHIIKNNRLEALISAMRHIDDVPSSVKYTESNLSLRFVDILTYPRPAKKFSMLLGKNTLLAFVREIMMTEVGLEDIHSLELLTKGKRIPRDSDSLSLQEFGIQNNQKIIISRVLGQKVVTNDDTVERNRKFVGDLLFGPAPHIVSKSGSDNTQSIVKTFTISHSFQLVGRILERLIVKRFSEAIHREETAKKSELELLALLDSESKVKAAEEEKRRKKKEKEKEKKKNKKQNIENVKSEKPTNAAASGSQELSKESETVSTPSSEVLIEQSDAHVCDNMDKIDSVAVEVDGAIKLESSRDIESSRVDDVMAGDMRQVKEFLYLERDDLYAMDSVEGEFQIAGKRKKDKKKAKKVDAVPVISSHSSPRHKNGIIESNFLSGSSSSPSTKSSNIKADKNVLNRSLNDTVVNKESVSESNVDEGTITLSKLNITVEPVSNSHEEATITEADDSSSVIKPIYDHMYQSSSVGILTPKDDLNIDISNNFEPTSTTQHLVNDNTSTVTSILICPCCGTNLQSNHRFCWSCGSSTLSPPIVDLLGKSCDVDSLLFPPLASSAPISISTPLSSVSTTTFSPALDRSLFNSTSIQLSSHVNVQMSNILNTSNMNEHAMPEKRSIAGNGKVTSAEQVDFNRRSSTSNNDSSHAYDQLSHQSVLARPFNSESHSTSVWSSNDFSSSILSNPSSSTFPPSPPLSSSSSSSTSPSSAYLSQSAECNFSEVGPLDHVTAVMSNLFDLEEDPSLSRHIYGQPFVGESNRYSNLSSYKWSSFDSNPFQSSLAPIVGAGPIARPLQYPSNYDHRYQELQQPYHHQQQQQQHHHHQQQQHQQQQHNRQQHQQRQRLVSQQQQGAYLPQMQYQQPQQPSSNNSQSLYVGVKDIQSTKNLPTW